MLTENNYIQVSKKFFEIDYNFIKKSQLEIEIGDTSEATFSKANMKHFISFT